MKFFELFFAILRSKFWSADGRSHNDALRANQGDHDGPGFSFWRALVS